MPHQLVKIIPAYRMVGATRLPLCLRGEWAIWTRPFNAKKIWKRWQIPKEWKALAARYYIPDDGILRVDPNIVVTGTGCTEHGAMAALHYTMGWY